VLLKGCVIYNLYKYGTIGSYWIELINSSALIQTLKAIIDKTSFSTENVIHRETVIFEDFSRPSFKIKHIINIKCVFNNFYI